MQKTTNYPLASAGLRIWMKILDYTLIIGLFILITLSLTWFCFQPDFKALKYDAQQLFSGMLLLAHIISIGGWWIYFVLIPRYCRGYTLFGYLLKARLVWTESNHLFRRIFKLQGFGVCFLFVIMAIFYTTTFAFDQPVVFIQNTFSLNGMQQADSNMKMVSSIFIALFVFSVFPVLGITVNTILNSRKATLLDEWCDIYLAHCKQSPIKLKPPHEESVLPGLIDINELEQI